MIGFLARRLVSVLVTLALASVVVFTVLEVLPGDPAQMALGTEAREDTLAALRREMGLDRPV
ncbi:MAG: ABC transporter permease, partial [Rhodospirillales bacterium]